MNHPRSRKKWSRPEPFDLEQIQSIPIEQRHNKVTRSMFSPVADPQSSLAEFLDSLPAILGAEQLRGAIEHTANSIAAGRPVLVAMGGHVVKVGMGPVINDLMRRGLIRGLVMNGSTAIHDYEMGLIGETSEDVAANVADGSFGMARETAQAFADACQHAQANNIGLGEALGLLANEKKIPYRQDCMLACAQALSLPVTVHVGVGTDVVHMHPQIDGELLGRATYHDFKLLAGIVCDLADGTWINIGSAVVLPEVFLKVVNMARNIGHRLDGITAINLDMLQQYRTSQNVLKRPVARGFSITGHHEINIPLFRMALLIELEKRGIAIDPLVEG